MGAHGESAHKILAAESEATIRGVAWSPGGSRLAYRYRSDEGNRTEIMVRSCDRDGNNQTTIVRDNRLDAFTWLSAERFIYSRNTESGSTESDNLWELRVDSRSGASQGQPRQLTDWSGFSVSSLSASSDGKRLAFLRGNDHASVFVGDLGGKESGLGNFRRLTLDDNYNILLDWTPDSREVMYSSQRTANRLMYRQGLEPGSGAQLISPGVDINFLVARMTPDGNAVLLEGAPVATHKMGIYRGDLKGGAPQLLFNTGGFVMFWCANKVANFCVYSRPSVGKNELAIVAFDPISGPGKEQLRIPLEPGSNADIGFDYSWQLSPDGAWIGLLKRRGNQIQLVPLRGGATRTIAVKGYPDLQELYFGMDSRSLFVSSREAGASTLLRVGLNGDAQPLWHQSQPVLRWGIPSPDERHVAIMGTSSEANAWMISNF